MLWLIGQIKSNILNALSAKKWHDKRLLDLRNLKASKLVGDIEIRKSNVSRFKKERFSSITGGDIFHIIVVYMNFYKFQKL